jgi:long-chain acyl-CoA synthetase
MAGSGETVTYGQLEERSSRLARLLRERGIGPGDSVAFLSENQARFFELCWAAQRSGLYYTPLNWHLRREDLEAIVADCAPSALLASEGLEPLADELAGAAPDLRLRLTLGPAYDAALASVAAGPFGGETEGADVLYSGGTTGRPKGIRFPLSGRPFGTPSPIGERLSDLHGIGEDTVHLVTGPLYHSGPLGFALRVQRRGGTVVVMEKFDAERALEAIERYRVTHSQWVPTMLVRLLRLPPEARRRHDLSSLRVLVHSAGPCPPEVKAELIEWLGPIVCEFYGGTERNGLTHIDSREWLAHRGSVGRPVYGSVHVLDGEGRELPPGEVGGVYFEGGPDFQYSGDPERTAASRSPQGWTTIGDLGYLDAEGYLYLTDRRDFMVVSGGVNVYPQATENVLLESPLVLDATVFGVPDGDLGEALQAVVQPVPGAGEPEEVRRRLLEHCRERLPGLQRPRHLELADELPRTPAGKIDRRALRDRYWRGLETRIGGGR